MACLPSAEISDAATGGDAKDVPDASGTKIGVSPMGEKGVRALEPDRAWLP